VEGLLSLGSFVLGAVAHHGVALRQVEVECDEGAVLHAQCTQSGAVDLGHKQEDGQSTAMSGGRRVHCL